MWFPIVMLLLAGAIITLVVLQYKGRSEPPSREALMVAMNVEPASSYAQKTNHLPHVPVDMGPVPGRETPFRVNLYQAHME